MYGRERIEISAEKDEEIVDGCSMDKGIVPTTARLSGTRKYKRKQARQLNVFRTLLPRPPKPLRSVS